MKRLLNQVPINNIISLGRGTQGPGRGIQRHACTATCCRKATSHVMSCLSLSGRPSGSIAKRHKKSGATEILQIVVVYYYSTYYQAVRVGEGDSGKGSQGSQCVQLSRGDVALKPLTHCDWLVVGQSSHSCVLVFRTKASSHSAMRLQPLHRLRGSGAGHSSLSDAASNLLI